MLYAVKELIDFNDITGTSYSKLQAVNIAYVILHRTSKFGLAICEWNRLLAIQKMWVRFKQYFWRAHQDLQETSDLTVEDGGMHHTNMVRDVVVWLQEALQQEQIQTETPTVFQAPVYHVANAVQNTQQQLATQLQKMQ